MKATWRYIDESNVSGSYGLAADEYLMHAVTMEDYAYKANLRLYNYANYSALCGRFQNLPAEINIDRCRSLGYDTGRRLTGGGAIIMGKDQLGLCLTIHGRHLEFRHTRELYRLFATPVIQALKKMGIPADFKSKNDLEVDGRKIAGLGVHIDKAGGVQFHTSLLYELNIPDMLEVLKIPIQKYDDRIKIRAVNQRMTTVVKESAGVYTMDQVKSLLTDAFSEYFGISFERKPITETEREKISILEQNRYKNPEWLFQNSPREDMSGMSLYKTKGGLLRTYIGLKGNTIKSVLITGDFVDDVPAFREIEARLKWAVLDAAHISSVIEDTAKKHAHWPGLIAKEDLAHAILLAGRKAKTALSYHYNGSCYYPEKKTVPHE